MNIFNIFDFMDCGCCTQHEHRDAILTSDGSYGVPEEEECRDGDFGNEYPCDRMLGAVEDAIYDGELYSACNGLLETGERLAEDQKHGEAVPQGYDFGTAPFWFIGSDGKTVRPYESIEEIYNEYFR